MNQRPTVSLTPAFGWASRADFELLFARRVNAWRLCLSTLAGLAVLLSVAIIMVPAPEDLPSWAFEGSHVWPFLVHLTHGLAPVACIAALIAELIAVRHGARRLWRYNRALDAGMSKFSLSKALGTQYRSGMFDTGHIAPD